MAMEGRFEARFEARCEELLEQAEVSADDWDGVIEWLGEFVKPFVARLFEPAQRRHFLEYTVGLLSTLERKTGEGIAYLHGQDRKQIQQFVGESPWEQIPILTELANQVGTQLGEADGVIVFDTVAAGVLV